jgi:hypothetical protein
LFLGGWVHEEDRAPSTPMHVWYTQEFYVSTGRVNWATHIRAFKFDSCGQAGR